MTRDGDIYFDDCTVQAVALGRTKKGDEQLVITFDTNDDPRYVTAYRFFTEAALPYTEADLRSLGWDPVANSWALDLLISSDHLVGAKASLVCAYEEYEGKKRLKVKFINAPGGGAVKDRMTVDEASDFTRRLRGRLGVTGGAAPRPQAVPAAVAEADDDPIPF